MSNRIARTVLLAAAVQATAAYAQGDRHDWSVHFDLNSASPSTPLGSWVDGSIGKLRYDESDDNISIGRIFLEYDGRIKPTLRTHIVADYVDDGSPGIDFTEAFVEWRPVPKSAHRQQLKVGFFYPPLSLENDGPGWSNDYAISNSAINTWLAEEVRTLGVEWRMDRPLGAPGSPQQISFHAATFFGNDPAGTLLAWKGWGIHDRQTRFDDVLPLPPLPQIGPAGMFQNQAVQAEPFIETDDRPGYYYGIEWRHGQRAMLALTHYDNHADPLSLRKGQYGWTTRFDHLGAQVELPGGVGLIAQWMKGTTSMGPVLNGARVVDTSFRSNFVLLTKALDQHRLTVRYDDFEVIDNDLIPQDENDDAGHAWTLAYGYDYSATLSFAVEWLQTHSYHPARTYLSLPATATERVLQLQVRLMLGARR